MNLQPKKIQFENYQPDFLITGNHLQYTAGNITLDSSELSVGQVVAQGTAVYEDEETGLFHLVQEDTPATMKGAVLTVHAVRIEDTAVNELTSGLVAGSVWEEKTYGVTDKFKDAVKNRINFDL